MRRRRINSSSKWIKVLIVFSVVAAIVGGLFAFGVFGDKKYTITLHSNTTSVDENSYVIPNLTGLQEYELPTYSSIFAGTPTQSFVAWNTKADGTGTVYDAGDTYVMSNTSVHLYATWEALTQYDLTYRNTDMEVGNFATNIAPRPTDPTKRGYEFDNWYMDATFIAPVTFPLTLTQDTDIYANFDIIDYTITYQLHDGTSLNATTYNVTQSINLSDAQKDGYSFTGWYEIIDEVQSLTPTTSISLNTIGNKVFNAVYSPINYTINYNLYGGTNSVLNPNSYNIETETITLSAATRDYYTFNGWFTLASGGTQITTIDTGSIGIKTLHAQWTAQTYDITYHLNDGTQNAGNPLTFTYETEFTLLEPTYGEDYEFVGWYTDASMAEQYKVTAISDWHGDKDLYAKWNLIDNSCTLIFENTDIADADYTINDVVTEPTEPIREGFTFNGWYNEGDFSTTVSWPLQITGDKTIYAKWTINDPNLTITGSLAANYNDENVTLTATASHDLSLEYSWVYKHADDVGFTLGNYVSSSEPVGLLDTQFFVDTHSKLGVYTIRVSVKIFEDLVEVGSFEESITFTLNIGQATFTIEDATKVYGEDNPAFTGSFDGTMDDATISSLGDLTPTCSATSSSVVGDYDITKTFTTSNYNITYNTGTLSITKKALTITADDKTRAYGEDNPTFTVSYAGFVLSQDNTVLGGTLVVGTSPATDSTTTPGTYNIVASGFTSSNYEIAFVNGTLTVTAPEGDLVVSDIASQVYTSSAIEPTFSVTNNSITLEIGVDYTVAYSDNINASTTATVNVTGIGEYAGLTGLKYFTITKAPLTVSWDYSAAFTYDGSQKTVAISSVSGKLGTDDVTVTADPSTCTQTNANNYTTSAILSGAKMANYSITSNASLSWTINPGSPSLSGSSSQTLVYNGSVIDPIVTYNGSGELSCSPVLRDLGDYESVIVTVSASGNYASQSITIAVSIVRPAVTFDANTGTIVTNATVYPQYNTGNYYDDNQTGNIVTSFPVATKLNGAFIGYSLTSNNSTGLIISYSGTSFTVESVWSGIESEKTLYAIYSATAYDITINPNGGAYDGNTETVNFSQPVDEEYTLLTPIRAGYDFAGWTGTGLTEPTMSITIPTSNSEDKSYTATWTERTFTVSYNNNGGTGTIANQDALYNSNIALNDGSSFTRNGCTLALWNTLANGTGTDYALSYVFSPYNLTTDLTLYAKWNFIDYTITYVENGGSLIDDLIYHVTSDTITLPTITRTGYTLSSWKVTALGASGVAYSALGTAIALNDTITQIYTGSYRDITVTAQWQIDTYTLTVNYYSLNSTDDTALAVTQASCTVIGSPVTKPTTNGTTYTSATVSHEYSTSKFAVTIERVNASYDYYISRGSVPTTSSNLNSITYNYTPDSNDSIDVYIYQKYTVSYNAGTATSGTAPASQDKIYGTELTLQTNSGNLAKTGYTFYGWAVSETTNGTRNYATGAAYATEANLVLYPAWTPSTATLTINHYTTNLDGISYTLYQTDSQTGKTVGATYNGADYDISITGFTFDHSTHQGIVLEAGGSTLNLYYLRNIYTISFNANGGTGTQTSITAEYEEDKALPATTTMTAPTNGIFRGWGAGASSTYVTSYNNDTSADVTYYAVWEYEVGYSHSDYSPITSISGFTYDLYSTHGESSYYYSYYVIGESIGSLSASLTGFTLAGWYQGSNVALGNTYTGGYTFIYPRFYNTLTAAPNGGYGLEYCDGSDGWWPLSATPSTDAFATKYYDEAIGALPLTPTKTSYYFTGWYTASSGGTQVTSSTTYDGSFTTIYAQWSSSEGSNVSLMLNGGTGTTSGSWIYHDEDPEPRCYIKYVTYGYSFTDLPTPTPPSGYLFRGWYTATTGGTKITSSTYFNGSPTTYYAQYGTALILTIYYYDTNSNYLDSDSDTVVSGSTVDPSSYEISISGYNYSYSDPSSSFTMNSDTTIYLYYAEDVGSVTFYVDFYNLNNSDTFAYSDSFEFSTDDSYGLIWYCGYYSASIYYTGDTTYVSDSQYYDGLDDRIDIYYNGGGTANDVYYISIHIII